jgi:16S rRNA (uracil1498-N3)-methyltransferase
MRLHRFYVSEDIGDKKELVIRSAELVNQLRRVFRLQIGDSIIIFNGTGFDYECKIDGFGEKSKISSDSVIRLLVISTERSRFIPERKLILCAGLVKKDTFEWITEKATELGVTGIIPIRAEHSEKKALNEKRLKKIAIEASEQSGRDATPMILPIMGQGEAAAYLKKENPGIQMIAFHTEGEKFARPGLDETRPVGVFIGPEGGWSPDEIDMFHKLNIPVVTLGPQILRSETAVIAALSQVVFY